jgi:trimeric autotransporter adhesin
MRCLRCLPILVVALFLSLRLIAQSPQVMPRIAGPVDERSLVVLTGNVPSIARAEFDRGEASASTQLSHVRLVLARSSQQQAALDTYDAQLQDKSSPNYHKWLTPEQFGKLYGPADSDIAAIVAWLQSHGMQVDPVRPARGNISFSGSVTQIQEMLHISIHAFDIRGEQFLSNTSNPSIPAALVPVISGVARLNTLKPKPQHVMGQMGVYDSASRRLQAASQSALRGPRANLTTGTGAASTLYLVPGDAATIYNTPNAVLNANFPSGTSYTGTGVTIGIGGDAIIDPATVASYRQRFLGDTKQPTVINVDGVTAVGDQDEAYLDLEIAGGLAPGADLVFYTASGVDVAIDQMLNDNAVDIFNLSFGACELDLTTGDNQLINSWWQQAASFGIAVTVSTGDDGSAACDNNNTQMTASSGLLVSGFASTPYNIAVGGTDFGPLLSSFSTYANPSTNNSAATFYRTALKYIPEWTWNDSTTVNTTISANVPFVDTANGNATNINGASGGKSTCSVNTTTYTTQENQGTCTSGYSKPAWQRGAGVPNDSARDLPDISLMSGAGGDAAAWLVCTDDQGMVGGATVTADCSTQTDGHFYFFGFGGTSTSAPAFAGILALVQQKTGSRLGQAAQDLYNLYNGAHTAAIFHDVTIGNISVPCTNPSPNCSKNTAGNYFLTGYDTTAGYDLATGMGSVDVNQLITYWGTGTGPETTIVTVLPGASTIARTAPLTVVGTVQGSTATGNPTGTVTLSGGGYTSSAQTVTASGADSATYAFSIPANSLNKGSDTLTASYSGDRDYAVHTGTATVTVTGLTPTVTVTPASANVTSGVSTTVGVLVAGTGATPTGTVTLSGGGYTSAAQALNGTGAYTFTVPAHSFTTSGAVTLTVSYGGDAGYNTAVGTAAINVAVSTFTLTATDVTVAAGALTGNASTITVTPSNGYTGTVVLTAAVTASPAGAVSAPTLAGSSVPITDANPKTGTVTVTTAAPGAVRTANPGSAWLRAAGGTAMAAFLLFCLPLGSRRNRRVLSLMLILVAATFTAVGCSSSTTTPTKATPSVTLSPSKSSFNSATAISVAVTVGGGTQTATGSVTLSGGGFNGTATALASGAATINIPANSFTSTGSVTLAASYSGDTNYNAGSGTTTVTVTKPGTTAGAYTVTVTGTDATAHITKTQTFTLTVN